MSTLLIVDSHALIHRAYHAIPPLTTKAGIPTNAIYGYFGMLHKTIIDLRPTHLVTCFDTPTESFRKKIITTYQATRKPTDDNLKVQFDLVKEVVDAAGIRRYESPGYEADDTIGTLVHNISLQLAANSLQLKIIILTGDKDMFQLVTDHVSVLTPQIGFSKSVLYDPARVIEKLGVTPDHVADLKALMGDASDHYDGLKNIGPKTAAKLISQYGSIEKMDTHFDAETMQILRTMKQVATIVTDIPDLEVDIDTLLFAGFASAMREALQKYELYSLLSRFFPAAKKTTEPKIELAKPESDTDQGSLF